MSSHVYMSYWHDVIRGLIIDGSATFKVMLLYTNGYTADENAKDTHLVRTSRHAGSHRRRPDRLHGDRQRPRR